ncbi:uracil-DNA glycosylase [Nematocida displodere]|uniref:Uracil-DNA glycosylase n=1 Tax=Nematocida displodere TaxID=1805483 RepID=A0A177EIH8_9MICR|nr:uracil-DNA glycosylase [Nematocida displodere]
MVFECSCDICSIEKQPLPGWQACLKEEFLEAYFKEIIAHLHTTSFFPKASQVLRCLSFFDCPETKVVILGQDPYHGPGQAVGLSFSVPIGVIPPPSLKNIKKEIEASTGKPSICQGGSLLPWVKQGVLLLNTTLTVLAKSPRSHASLGWSKLTDEIILSVSAQTTSTVFMLWGKDAQEKERLIDAKKHLILTSPHPSPFSARKGFFGSKHFQLANEYLELKSRGPIVW